MNANERQTIAARIQQARSLRGWSQRELAEAATVAPNTVGAIEAGRSVHARSLARVASVLGINPLIEAQADAGYPADIELVRDAIGMWLRDLTPDERAEQVRKLLRAITGKCDG